MQLIGRCSRNCVATVIFQSRGMTLWRKASLNAASDNGAPDRFQFTLPAPRRCQLPNTGLSQPQNLNYRAEDLYLHIKTSLQYVYGAEVRAGKWHERFTTTKQSFIIRSLGSQLWGGRKYTTWTALESSSSALDQLEVHMTLLTCRCL
jgi:hypothetical protein